MLKRITVSDLRLGMYLVEFCGSWVDHPFWRERFLLTKAEDRQRVLDSPIREVWIDTAKGLDVAVDVPVSHLTDVRASADALLAAVGAQRRAPSRVTMAEEMQAAERICVRSKNAVVEMFGHARLGLAIDLEQAGQLVDEITQSIVRHPHALVSLARLKTIDDYTFMHSVAVCALMIGLARQLGLAQDIIREAGLAGLLHDIGKMAIPLEILNKPGKLTDQEFTVVHTHPEEGGRILRGCQQVSALVLDVCLHHHEKVDGTGYPHRLAGEQISVLGRMAAICDVYDAITSDRPYKKGWGPSESIRKMAEWEGHFDVQIFQSFVKTVGIYPVGSLVRLESGRLAVVLEQNEASLLKPVVKVFFSTRNRTAIPQQRLDLAAKQCTDRIVARESNEVWKFTQLESLWR